MSEIRSVGSVGNLSSSSTPIFSANDQDVDFFDPDFTPAIPSQQLGGLPYSNTAASYATPGPRGMPPVPADLSDSGLFYSFTDPSHKDSKPTPQHEARGGIIDSFGVSAHLYQSTLAKSKVSHSISAPVIRSDREEKEPPVGNVMDGPELEVTSLLADGVSLGSREDTPTPVALSSGNSQDTHEGSAQDIHVPAQDIHVPTLGSSQDIHVPTHGGPESSQNIRSSPLVTKSAISDIAPDQATFKDNNITPVCVDPSDIPDQRPEGELPPLSRLDSDIETASVVSVQHLTETYLNDPSDSIDGFTPLSEGGKVPFTFPIVSSIKSESLPSETYVAPSSPSRSRVNPKTSKLPAHLHPTSKKPFYEHTSSHDDIPNLISVSPDPSSSSHSRVNSILGVCDKPGLLNSSGTVDVSDGHSKPPEDNLSEVVESLEDKLAEEQRARSYLEGQLEAVKEECKAALKERPSLLSKLSRAEAQLAETMAALKKEKEKERVIPNFSPRSHYQADLKDTAEALEQQKRVAIDLKNDFIAERQKSNRLERNLDDSKRTLEEQRSSIAELHDKLQSCQLEMAKKTDESEERAYKLASLEASYDTLEKNKSRLHEQLERALESKLKSQEEVRESKTHGVTQEIKLDQLHKENAALQVQIGSLQKGVLQDKSKMVSQLEAIEADVLSHEDLYTKLILEKALLEDIVKRKDEDISQLNGNLARAQVDQDEIKQKMKELQVENNNLAHIAEKEGTNASNKLKVCLRDLELKDSDLRELNRVKNSLQDKLRHTDAEIMSKDGAIQCFEEEKALLQHELDLVNESKENLSKELADAKCEIAELEVNLNSALEQYRKKDLQLKGITDSQHSVDDQKQALHTLLAEKEGELEQKEEAIRSLETQVSELLGEFGALRDSFKSIASESGSATDNLAEKDRVISYLASEKDKGEEELCSLRKENQELHDEIGQLQHERAHLQGKVEGSINQDDYQKSLQDKARLQADLNASQLEAQRGQIKAQARINRLEANLKGVQKNASKTQAELQNLKDERDEILGKLNEVRYQSDANLKKVQEELKKVLKEREKAEKLVNSSRPSQGQLEILRAKSEELMNQNHQLVEQLQQEIQNKAEIERASGLVVKKLKQNAEKEKKDLVRKNRDISLELERLRGRLAGMHTTQTAIRDHASTLETALANKESSIVKLSAETQSVLEEKALEDKAFEEQVAGLEDQLKDLNRDLVGQKEEALKERHRVQELERELSLRSSELATLQAELPKRSSNSIPSTNEHLASLSLEKDALQSNVTYLKSQLLVSKTLAESAKREVADKQSQIEILERELEITESKYQQAENEAKQLKLHLKKTDEMESSHILGERGSEGHSGMFDSLSTISGVEEVDTSGEELVMRIHI